MNQTSEVVAKAFCSENDHRILKINKIEYDVSATAMITGLSEFIVECAILSAQNVTHVKCKEIRKRKLSVSEYIDALAFKDDCKKQYELFTN